MTPPYDPFEGLIGQLSKGGRAAYPFIRGLALSRPDLSPTAIFNQLSGAGYELRKQTTLDIVALLRNKGDLVRFQRTFGSSAIIPDSLHTRSPLGFSKGARVQYEVGLKSANDLVPHAIFVNARNNLSIDQVIGATISILNQANYSAQGFNADDVTEFTINDAKYHPGLADTGEFPAPNL